MANEEILDTIKGMSVLELSELVKALEETFGVSAAAPVAVAAAPAAAAMAGIVIIVGLGGLPSITCSPVQTRSNPRSSATEANFAQSP